MANEQENPALPQTDQLIRMLGEFPIPNVSLDNLSLDSAMDEITRIAKTNGANDAGFKGIVVVHPGPVPDGISMRLNSAPLGLVLQGIVNSVGCYISEIDGVIVVRQYRQNVPGTAYGVFEILASAKEQMRISGSGAESNAREAVGRLHVTLGSDSAVRLSADGNTMVVRGEVGEVRLLDRLIALLNRGLKLEAPSP